MVLGHRGQPIGLWQIVYALSMQIVSYKKVKDLFCRIWRGIVTTIWVS